MTFRSTSELEREFFRAFFAALGARGKHRIAWRSADTVRRFRGVSAFLLAHADDDDDVRRLADRLRPDPIGGGVPALVANVAAMQPGSVGNPNPSYTSVTVADAELFMNVWEQQMSPAVRALLPAAVAAFLRDDEDDADDDDDTVFELAPHAC